jgi:hypothetical protein
MSFIGDSPKLKRTRYTPQSADPVNPQEGDVFYSDGTPRAEGLWLYQDGSWIAVASQGFQRVEFADKEFVTVRCATTGNVTLASQVEAGDTIDGIVLVAGNLVLVKDQTISSENGVYVVQSSGAPVRDTSADTAAKLSRLPVYVSAGTKYKNTDWWQQNVLTNLSDAQSWLSSGPQKGYYLARVATTGNINLATDLANGNSIDGITLVTGDLILVKNQTTSRDNGLYVAPAAGAASRSTLADTAAELSKLKVQVQLGTVNAGKTFYQDNINTFITDTQVWLECARPAAYTWTVPTGVTQVLITAAGGGGGGGAGLNSFATGEYISAGGGGAGAIPQEVVLDVQFGDSLSIQVGSGGRGGFAELNNTYGLNGEDGQQTIITRTGPSGTKVLKFRGAPAGLKGALANVASLRFVGSPGGGSYRLGGFVNSLVDFQTLEANNTSFIAKGGYGGGLDTSANYYGNDSAESAPIPGIAYDTFVISNDGWYYREVIMPSGKREAGTPGQNSSYAQGGVGGAPSALRGGYYGGGGGGGGAGFGVGGAGGNGTTGAPNTASNGVAAAAGTSAGGGGGASQCFGGGSLAATSPALGGRGGSGKVIITY